MSVFIKNTTNFSQQFDQVEWNLCLKEYSINFSFLKY